MVIQHVFPITEVSVRSLRRQNFIEGYFSSHHLWRNYLVVWISEHSVCKYLSGRGWVWRNRTGNCETADLQNKTDRTNWPIYTQTALRNSNIIFVRHVEEWPHVEHLGVHERIVSECIWTGLIWIRIGLNGELLWANWSALRFLESTLFHGCQINYRHNIPRIILRSLKSLVSFTTDTQSSPLFALFLNLLTFNYRKSFSASSSYFNLGLPTFLLLFTLFRRIILANVVWSIQITYHTHSNLLRLVCGTRREVFYSSASSLLLSVLLTPCSVTDPRMFLF